MAETTEFEREIREQPEVVARLVTGARELVGEIADRVRHHAPDFVLIAARGSSDNAARYAKYVLGAKNRLAVGLAAPALSTMYRSPPMMGRALVIGISQSGESPDVVGVVSDAARQGALTLALTNQPTSPLGRAAALCLPLGAGPERAVAASKTYTSQLAAMAVLSAALMASEAERSEAWAELEQIDGAMRGALVAVEPSRAAATALAGAQRIAVLGRGYNLATAFEAALKIKETCYVAAEPYSWADFLHGPVAVVERGFPVLVVAPSGAASADAGEIAARLLDRGALLAVASDRGDLLAAADAPLPLPSGTPDWLTPLVAILPCQMLALALALARGNDPDRPRGLSKVTRTV